MDPIFQYKLTWFLVLRLVFVLVASTWFGFDLAGLLTLLFSALGLVEVGLDFVFL